MWIRDTDGIEPLSYNGNVLRMPHTIVFLHGAPAQWYFTSKIDGKYLRRKKKKVSINEIIDHFSKQEEKKVRRKKRPRKASDRIPGMATSTDCADNIVALWMTNSAEDARRIIEYLTYKQLRRFVLTGGARKSSGILQEYVKSAGDKHRTIRVDWTPHICQIEMCESRFRQNTKLFTNEEKLADFDSREGDTFKKKISVTSKKGAMIDDFSAAIARRIEAIANKANGLVMDRLPTSPTGRPSTPLTQYLSTCSLKDQLRFMSYRVHRCILHFIVSADGSTYFTYSTFLDIGQTSTTTKRINANGLYSASTMVEKLSASNRRTKKRKVYSPPKDTFSKTCENLGLGGTCDFGEQSYKNYGDDKYAKVNANANVNFTFTSESLLQNEGKLLRRFIRNYSYNTFGCLDVVGVFRLFHASSGVLGIQEFKSLFKEVNIAMTARQLKRVVSLFDKDGDGKIDSSEFLDWIMQEAPTRTIRKSNNIAPNNSTKDNTVRKAIPPSVKKIKKKQQPKRRNLLLPLASQEEALWNAQKRRKSIEKPIKKRDQNLHFLQFPKPPTQARKIESNSHIQQADSYTKNNVEDKPSGKRHMTKSEAMKFAYTQKLNRPPSKRRAKKKNFRHGRKTVHGSKENKM